MALLKALCWALIFIIRIRFPPGTSLATVLLSTLKSYIRLDKGHTLSAFSILVEIAICLLIVYRMATF